LRPIKLTVASEEQKDKILRLAKNLKSKRDQGYDRVFIYQDLTLTQRAVRQKLVQELKERKSKGEQKPYNSERKDCDAKDERGHGDVKLKCFYTNACIVLGKMHELRERMQGYDIVGIVETWANGEIWDAELSIDGFNMFRLDRVGNAGGGLLIYTRTHQEMR